VFWDGARVVTVPYNRAGSPTAPSYSMDLPRSRKQQGPSWSEGGAEYDEIQDEDGDGNGNDGISAQRLCSFCRHRRAAVAVLLPSKEQEREDSADKRRRSGQPQRVGGNGNNKKKQRHRKLLCLLHYYTTSACRIPKRQHRSEANEDDNDQVVEICDRGAFEDQLPAVQEAFADVYVETQKQLSEESARAFQASANDPLSILNSFRGGSRRGSSTHKKKRKRVDDRKPPPPSSSSADADRGGGFLRNEVRLPQRVVDTQRRQAEKQRQLAERMRRAAAAASSPSVTGNSGRTTAIPRQQQQRSATQRRKSSRKSIWNQVMDEDQEETGKDRVTAERKDPPTGAEAGGGGVVAGLSCTCGSTNVEELTSNATRNPFAMAKAETWGSKIRDDVVVTRYRCLRCGKVWNEEE